MSRYVNSLSPHQFLSASFVFLLLHFLGFVFVSNVSGSLTSCCLACALVTMFSELVSMFEELGVFSTIFNEVSLSGSLGTGLKGQSLDIWPFPHALQ